MNDIHFYEVKLTWNELRKGVLTSPNLNPLTVATPPEFPEGHPGIWSPEHYFIAAINSCFMTTFLAVAEYSKLEFKSFECDSIGKLEKVGGKLIICEVLLKPSVLITDVRDMEKAERVINKSEAACIISNSIKSKILISLDLKVAKPEELVE
jgi:organic hydroperoxide reductase OsmC/OhrA